MHSGAEPRNERSRVFGALDKFDPLQELAVNYLWDKRRGPPWECIYRGSSLDFHSNIGRLEPPWYAFRGESRKNIRIFVITFI